MKTNWIKQTLLAGLAVLGLMAGQAVYAQTTSATVDVTAVVPKACRFFTASSSMTIEHSGGLIDPTSGSNATGSTTLNYRCMTGINPLFNIDSDVGGPASPKTVTVVLTDGGTNNMNADITVTATGGAGTGLGGGQDKIATVSGLIAPLDFQAAAPATYTKTVTIDITAQ